jgi:hypothetical protein
MKDDLGLELSGADHDSFAHYRAALRGLQTFTGDPVAAIDAAIASAPGFVMAHVLKGYFHVLSTEAAALPVARGAWQTAALLPATQREKAHVEALGRLVAGRWLAAGDTLAAVADVHPHDALALQIGHQIDFFTGNTVMLRDRVGRALAVWSAGMPGYHALLSAHAFGLEETGDYAAAERMGRRAVELEPRDGWGHHAVAHVMEMQSRQKDGVAWMRGNLENWSRDSFLKVHNWWHLALFHYELGEAGTVLSLFDGPIYGSRSTFVLHMVDASAILWRLHIGGVNVGDRWQALADNWEPLAGSGNYAFNDMHAMMAFVGAGRSGAIARLLEAQEAAMQARGDNAMFTREVGHPATLAILAFGEQRYDDTVRLLTPLRSVAHRFGGSHAQRDVLDLTLMEAAIRAGDRPMAARLAGERAIQRPHSPLSRLFAERAAMLATDAGAEN